VVRVRRRGVGLVGGAVLLFLAGTNIQSGWLFVFSSLLLGAAVGGAIVPAFMVRGLSVERAGPDEAFVGEDVPVELAVTNHRGGARVSIGVRDPHIAPASVFLARVGAGQTAVARTERRATRRGITEAGTVTLTSSAPFGVAESRRTVPCPGRMVILPRVVLLGRLPFFEEGVASGDDASVGTRRGEGTEYAGVREYRRGDSMRHVHWPATARHGSLVVREMERERPGSLAIVVDTWADAGTGETALDLCCTVAGSVALAALADGHEIRMAGELGADASALVRMGRSEALRWLAALTPSGGSPFPTLLHEVVTGTSGVASLFLVFPTWKPNAAPRMHSAVAPLTARGLRVTAAIVDASRFGSRTPVLLPREMAELESALRSCGADVRWVRGTEDVRALEHRSEERR
jgi:uncharacterized protein (DUF58 family)